MKTDRNNQSLCANTISPSRHRLSRWLRCWALECLRAQYDDGSMTASTTAGAGLEAPSGSPIDISAPAPPDWDRVDAAEASSDEDQVLELPQVDPGQARAGSDAAQDGSEGAEESDQVGGVDDYEEQSAMPSAGVYLFLIPAGASRNGIGLAPVPAAPGIRALPGIGAMAPASQIIARPGGLGPFPATSPMLTPPQDSMVMPAGGFHPMH
jgi:hypothetical protein